MQPVLDDAAKRTVVSQISKTSDIEVRLSYLETAAGTFVDIREYVVSLDRYGRGVTMTEEQYKELVKGDA